MAAKITLAGEWKLGNANGKTKPPLEDDPTYSDWEAEIVLLYLGSFNPWNCPFLGHSCSQNLPRIFGTVWPPLILRKKLYKDLWTANENHKGYVGRLSRYQLPSMVQPQLNGENILDITTFMIFSEDITLTMSLLGQISWPKSLPSIGTMLSLLQWEESHQRIMKISKPQPERSGFVTSKHKGSKENKRQLTPEEKQKLVCTHCGKTRHAKETCWELIGHI